MARQVKPLLDSQIANAKNKVTKTELYDGGGLILELRPLPSKKKIWRYKYKHLTTGKQVPLTLGEYPAVTLKSARDKREMFERWLENTLDPKEQLKLENAPTNTFELVATEWLSRQTDKAQSTRDKSTWLLSFPIGAFGNRPIEQITPVMVLEVCRKEEEKYHLETARRIKSKCSQVFRYAVATGRFVI